MKRVIQKDLTGCGLACIAMVTENSYAKVKEAAIKLNMVNENGPFYTQAQDLRNLLLEFKVETGVARNVKNWEKISCISIVGINHEIESGNWHWVVFVSVSNGKRFVYDPKKSVKTTKRTDFWRMRLRSFIPIKFKI